MTNESMRHAEIRGFMAFTRRVCLLTFTDDDTALLIILGFALEDLLARCSIVGIDRSIIRFMRSRGVSIHVQRDVDKSVWKSDANLTNLAELFSIIAAFIFHLILQPQAMAFNLGYPASGSLAAIPLFVKLLCSSRASFL